MSKILLIQMSGLTESVAIGVPALRYLKQQHPDAQIDVLSYAKGKDVFRLAEPFCHVFGPEEGQWPDDFIAGLEAFLGLAEVIVGQQYSRIINLDLGFLPCFLARFLKDAGEPVEGNFLSISVDELITQFSKQTLSADYVNDSSAYIASGFAAMPRWFSPWWEGTFVPDHGFGEFYLRSCCGFEPIDMQLNLQVAADETLRARAKGNKIILVCQQASIPVHSYPYAQQLVDLLNQAGWHAELIEPEVQDVADSLAQLKVADLVVAPKGSALALGSAVGTTTLLISGQTDPRSIMPDFATDPDDSPVSAQTLADDIQALLGGMS